MSFYENNLAALRAHNGYFLGDFSRAAAAASGITVRRYHGDLIAMIEGREHPLKRLARLDGADPGTGFYVVNGFGDGSLIRLVFALKHVEHVLVYEPQTAFLKALWEAEDFSTLLADSRLRFVVGGDEERERAALSRYFYEDPFRLMHVFRYAHLTSPGTESLAGNAAAYAGFQKFFVEEVQAKLERVKPNEEDAFWGFLNTMDNFPGHFTNPSLDCLAGAFAGKPGVVVAAGPSLDSSLPLLKRHRDEVVIFCCDAALKKLLEHGIVPDFIATQERIGASGEFLRDAPGLEGVPLLASSLVPAATLERYPGPKLFLRAEGGFDDWVSIPSATESIGNVPSVAHLCYVGLRRMGCDPVCLLGQDLSYDPVSGASHAGGVSFPHDAAPESPQAAGLCTVPGFDGKPRKTNFLWRHFGRLYGVLIKKYGGRVLNLMPPTHGIPIDMTERADPEAGFGAVARGPVGKDVIFEKLRTRTKDPAAVMDYGRASLTRWRADLRHFRGECLSAMRELSAAWRDFKPAPNLPAFEAEFARLFDSFEVRLSALRRHDESAFDRGFLGVVMNSFLGLRIERARILNGQMNFVDRTSAMIQLYFKTFNLIHLWASRCLEALEHGDATRWKIWEGR